MEMGSWLRRLLAGGGVEAPGSRGFFGAKPYEIIANSYWSVLTFIGVSLLALGKANIRH